MFPPSPAVLLSRWLRGERAAGHLSAGLEVHTWYCPDGESLGRLDLAPLGLVGVSHEPPR